MAPQGHPIYCNILVLLAQPLRATIYHKWVLAMAPQECPIYCNILVPLAIPLRASIYHNGSSQWHHKNVPYITIYRSCLPYRCGHPYIIMGPRNGTTRMSHILLLLATEYIGPACTTVAGNHIS